MQWWILTRSAEPSGRRSTTSKVQGDRSSGSGALIRSLTRPIKVAASTGPDGCSRRTCSWRSKGASSSHRGPPNRCRRLHHVLTEAPVGDQLVTNERLERLQRQLSIEEQQCADDHGVHRRTHVPARGVRARQALGPRVIDPAGFRQLLPIFIPSRLDRRRADRGRSRSEQLEAARRRAPARILGRSDESPLPGRQPACWGFVQPSRLAPEEGFEPPTRRLTAACSATELLRNVRGAHYEERLSSVKRRLGASAGPGRRCRSRPCAGPAPAAPHRRSSSAPGWGWGCRSGGRASGSSARFR